MNGSSMRYIMPVLSGLMGSALLFKDEYQEITEAEDISLTAAVRSGDYFVTLASRLDGLGQEIDSYGTRVQIESIVSDLIYLQDNYTIQKKEK